MQQNRIDLITEILHTAVDWTAADVTDPEIQWISPSKQTITLQPRIPRPTTNLAFFGRLMLPLLPLNPKPGPVVTATVAYFNQKFTNTWKMCISSVYHEHYSNYVTKTQQIFAAEEMDKHIAFLECCHSYLQLPDGHRPFNVPANPSQVNLHGFEQLKQLTACIFFGILTLTELYFELVPDTAFVADSPVTPPLVILDSLRARQNLPVTLAPLYENSYQPIQPHEDIRTDNLSAPAVRRFKALVELWRKLDRKCGIYYNIVRANDEWKTIGELYNSTWPDIVNNKLRNF